MNSRLNAVDEQTLYQVIKATHQAPKCTPLLTIMSISVLDHRQQQQQHEKTQQNTEVDLESVRKLLESIPYRPEAVAVSELFRPDLGDGPGWLTLPQRLKRLCETLMQLVRLIEK